MSAEEAVKSAEEAVKSAEEAADNSGEEAMGVEVPRTACAAVDAPADRHNSTEAQKRRPPPEAPAASKARRLEAAASHECRPAVDTAGTAGSAAAAHDAAAVAHLVWHFIWLQRLQRLPAHAAAEQGHRPRQRRVPRHVYLQRGWHARLLGRLRAHRARLAAAAVRPRRPRGLRAPRAHLRRAGGHGRRHRPCRRRHRAAIQKSLNR